MGEARPSTAVLLTRRRRGELEVYLVERAGELAFFGGWWALPGGALDAVDGAEDEAALARCGLRELFEETGVLPGALGRDRDPRDRARLRASLCEREPDSRGWRAWIDERPEAIDELARVCTLTTPRFSARRFRTHFVHLELPEGERPSIVEGELVGGRFVRPGDALTAWRAGELLIVPPVLLLLQLLERSGSLDAFRRAASTHAREVEAGRLHSVQSVPGVFLAPLRTPTIPPATTTNCVLLGERRVWVVDPATWEDDELRRLHRCMDEWIADGRVFEGVVLTHHHHDHVGGVVATCARYGLPLWAHPETLARLSFEVDDPRPLEEGDRLELGTAPDGSADWHARVLFTPGHAPGHVVLVDSRYGTAIAGDMVSTLSTILIEPPDGHLATYLASLRRLEQEPIGMIVPAHGMPARDGQALVRAFLAHRQAREDALVRALEDGVAHEEGLVERVYPELPASGRALAGRSLRSGLDKLVEEGRARREGSRWFAARS